MKVYHLINGLLRVNTYFLINDNSQAVVIDCGENYKKVKQFEKDYNVKIEAVLLTHAHFDHSGCARKLQEDGAKIYIGKKDALKLTNDGNLGSRFGRSFEALKPDFELVDGQKINVCSFDFTVIETPGHTDGSICYVLDDMIFSGDTLFFECIGRSDFPTGDKDQLISSVKKLFNLKGEYNVYPGHQEFTTLSHERKYNLFVDYD